MQKLSPLEINEICEELGETYPKSIDQVHGGDIHSAWQIEFSNKKLFLKKNIRNKKFNFSDWCVSLNSSNPRIKRRTSKRICKNI